MDIQLHDTYFVLPWYAWLPIIFTVMLISLLVAMTRTGPRTLYFVTLCVAVSLLLSLSGWITMVTAVISSPALVSDSSPDKPATWTPREPDWLNNVVPGLFAYQFIVVGIILLLSWRMINGDQPASPQRGM